MGCNDVESVVTFLRARQIELQTGLPTLMDHAVDETLDNKQVLDAKKRREKMIQKNRGGNKSKSATPPVCIAIEPLTFECTRKTFETPLATFFVNIVFRPFNLLTIS